MVNETGLWRSEGSRAMFVHVLFVHERQKVFNSHSYCWLLLGYNCQCAVTD